MEAAAVPEERDPVDDIVQSYLQGMGFERTDIQAAMLILQSNETDVIMDYLLNNPNVDDFNLSPLEDIMDTDVAPQEGVNPMLIEGTNDPIMDTDAVPQEGVNPMVIDGTNDPILQETAGVNTQRDEIVDSVEREIFENERARSIAFIPTSDLLSDLLTDISIVERDILDESHVSVPDISVVEGDTTTDLDPIPVSNSVPADLTTSAVGYGSVLENYQNSVSIVNGTILGEEGTAEGIGSVEANNRIAFLNTVRTDIESYRTEFMQILNGELQQSDLDRGLEPLTTPLVTAGNEMTVGDNETEEVISASANSGSASATASATATVMTSTVSNNDSVMDETLQISPNNNHQGGMSQMTSYPPGPDDPHQSGGIENLIGIEEEYSRDTIIAENDPYMMDGRRAANAQLFLQDQGRRGLLDDTNEEEEVASQSLAPYQPSDRESQVRNNNLNNKRR